MKISSSTASLPNLTPFLFLVTAAAIYLASDRMGMMALLVLGAGALLIMVAWVTNRPEVGIFLLLLASAVPRVSVEIGGLNARPEHLVSGLMICAAPFLWKKRQPIQWVLPDYLLMAYMALNFISSFFGSTDPSQTIKWAAQQVLAIMFYFWLRMFVSDWEKFKWAFRALLLVGAITAAYAIFAFYCSVFLGTAFGVEIEQYVDISATYGLQFEANILGAYSGALAVMMLVAYIHERRAKYLIGCTFFGLIAMTASLSRAAVGATMVALLLVALFGFKKRLINAHMVASIAVASICAATLILPFVLQHYVDRFSTIDLADPSQDPNTVSRAVQTVGALDEITNHPILGGGTASFQLAFDWTEFGTDWKELAGWIGNTELRVMHDTGAIGLVIFSLFVFFLALQGWKLLRARGSPELGALMASAVVYLISFQATEGTLLAFPWVHLGLIGCAVSLGRAESDLRRRALTDSPEI